MTGPAIRRRDPATLTGTVVAPPNSALRLITDGPQGSWIALQPWTGEAVPLARRSCFLPREAWSATAGSAGAEPVWTRRIEPRSPRSTIAVRGSG